MMLKWWIVYIIGFYLVGRAVDELLDATYENGYRQGEIEGASRVIITAIPNTDAPVHRES